MVYRSTRWKCSVKTISRKFFAHRTLLLPLGNNDYTTKKKKEKNVDGIFLSPKFFSFLSCSEAALFRRRCSGYTDTLVLFCFGFLLRACVYVCVCERARARVMRFLYTAPARNNIPGYVTSWSLDVYIYYINHRRIVV